MSKTTNKFSPEVRQRAVRLVLDQEHEHPSRWAATLSIASKIGCTGQTLNAWVKKSEVDAGKRAGVPTDMAARLKALERENRAGIDSLSDLDLTEVDGGTLIDLGGGNSVFVAGVTSLAETDFVFSV